MARSHGNASATRKRSRRAKNSMARLRSVAITLPAGDARGLFASIESCGPDQQDQDGDRVNREAAGVGKKIFACGIANAEDERRGERSPHAARAADSNNKQKEHKIDDSETRRQAKKLNREPAAERSQAAADRKRKREQAVDIDPDRLRHASVVDRSANLGADIGSLEAVPENADECGADDDEKDSVGWKTARTKVKPAGEIIGNVDRFRQWSIKVGVGRDGHEGETDGQKHL